jgi:hypothetical protein
MRPKAASHVADDHTDITLGHAERRRHRSAKSKRGLAGRPNHELPRFGRHEDCLRLHWDRRQPLVDEASLDCHLGAGQDVIVAAGSEMIGHVGTVGRKEQGRALVARGIHIDDDRERLEVEPDQLGSIHGRISALSDHKRNWLTNEPDATDGKRWPGEDLRHHLEANASG